MYGKIVKITLRRRVSPDKKCELIPCESNSSLCTVRRKWFRLGRNRFRSNEAKLPRLGMSEAIYGFGGERECGQGPSCGLVPFVPCRRPSEGEALGSEKRFLGGIPPPPGFAL